MLGNCQVADLDDVGAEFFDLWSAETSDDLRRVLVLYSPMRGSADAFEPYALLSKHHDTDPSSTAVTAMLMVTDIRWRGGAGNLIRRIEQSGMVDDGALDATHSGGATSTNGRATWTRVPQPPPSPACST